MDSQQPNTAAQRAHRYWRQTFDVPPDVFARPGVIVWPHPQRLTGRKGAWLLAHGPSSLISVPRDRLHPIRQRRSPGTTAVVPARPSPAHSAAQNPAQCQAESGMNGAELVGAGMQKCPEMPLDSESFQPVHFPNYPRQDSNL